MNRELRHFPVPLVVGGGLLLMAKVAAFGQEENNKEDLSSSEAAPVRAKPGMVQGWRELVSRQSRRAREENFEIMFVGDSLTQFWEAQGEPVWLLDFEPLKAGNFGVAADRVENILWRLQNGLLPREDGKGKGKGPKLFVLMMGTNNLAASPPTSPQGVANGIRTVLDFIEARRPNALLLLLSILPSGELSDASGLRGRIEATNRLLELMCAERRKVTFLNVHDRFVTDDGQWLAGLSLDGTHLSRRGYDVLAAAIRPSLVRMLADQSGEIAAQER